MTAELNRAFSIGAEIANAANIPNPTSIRVLCIDDSENDFILLRRLLRPMEFLVDHAISLEDADARIAQLAHDLYLVDFAFAATNGLDLIRKWFQKVKGPMLIWTGMPKECVENWLWAGDTQLLLKDQLLDGTLERDVRQALASYRQGREKACYPIAQVR